MSEVLTIELERSVLDRLKVQAEGAGQALSDYVADLLGAVVNDAASDWSVADARLAEYDQTGRAYDARTVMAEFTAEVRRRAAGRA